MESEPVIFHLLSRRTRNASEFRHEGGFTVFLLTRRSQSGFTLLETAVVTVLATVILSITIPKIEQFLGYYRLSASADLVASELNAGRALAISRNWIYDVNLDAGNSTIQIIDPNAPNNAPRTEKSLQSGNTFSSVPVNRIRFYSRGHARAGTIVLVNESGYSISIVVSPSGRIKQS